MPTAVQLEYIVAVDTYRHFGIAAQKCFVTQPTLSMQIRKAEEELGVVLFDRSKQPVIPTDVGIAVIQQARIILREMQRLEEVIQGFQEDVSGQLRVGIIPTIAPYLFPLFVGNFLKQYPHVSLQVRELTTSAIIEQLENDVLDVGILATPLHEPQIQEQPLFYEEIKVYISKNHPLIDQPNIPIEELGSRPMWLLSQGHCFRNQIINLCHITKTEEINKTLEYESGSLESLRRLVDIEGGITLLPELAVLEGGEQVKSLNDPLPLREVSLVFVRNFAKRRIVQLLAEHIRQSIPPHLLDATRGQIVAWK